MSTEFLTNDIRFLQSRAHSTITLDSGSSDVSSITFTSGSNNISSPTTASTYYTSLNHLFYNKHSNGNIGMYYYESGYNRIPMHKNKFNDNGIVINVSADRYGEYVKPGTFSYYDSSNDVDFILRDDGYGNLYSVDPQLTQSSTTSISSSDNYIGNIFYEHGIAVVTETGSYNSSGSGQFYVSGGANYSMSFDSSISINTVEYICKLLPHQYNWSTNPTILSGSDTITTSSFYYSNSTDMEVNRNRSGYVYGHQGNNGWTKLIHEETMSVWRLNDPVIDKKFRDRTFMPYITKLALRNRYDEVMMVASFENPIQKRNDETMTIKVQMDF